MVRPSEHTCGSGLQTVNNLPFLAGGLQAATTVFWKIGWRRDNVYAQTMVDVAFLIEIIRGCFTEPRRRQGARGPSGDVSRGRRQGYEANRPRWRSEKTAANWMQQLERHAFPILGDMPSAASGAHPATWRASPG